MAIDKEPKSPGRQAVDDDEEGLRLPFQSVPRLKRANTAGPGVLVQALAIESRDEGEDNSESDSSSETSSSPDAEDSKGPATPPRRGNRPSLTPSRR
jgi:3-methyladenine DNA glycosylase Mpg